MRISANILYKDLLSEVDLRVPLVAITAFSPSCMWDANRCMTQEISISISMSKRGMTYMT